MPRFPLPADKTRATAAAGRLRVLLLAQQPPPVHGVTVTSRRVKETLERRLDALVEPRWAGSARSLTEIEQRGIGKLAAFAALNLSLAGHAIRGARYDVAYTTFVPWTHTALRDGLMVWWAKRLGRRTLVHLHGEGLAEMTAGRGLKPRLLRALVAGTELIAITSEAARVAEASGLFTRVHRLANAAPEPTLPFARPHAEPPLRLGFLANLDPRKGVLRFVEALGHLIEAGQPVRGEIAGGSTAHLSVEALREMLERRGLAPHVRVHGPVAGEDKARFLASLDVLLYLTTHDHAPLVVVEALANGVVPVVLETGGLAEMIGAGFARHVFPADLEPAALHARLEALVAAYVADPARLALHRRSARARFEAEFTESRFGDRLAAIIAVPAKGSGRGEPALAPAASPRIEGLQALKSLTFSISRSLHARVLARPLPDRIAVYFHGLEAADRQALAQCVAALRGLGYRSVGLDAYLDPATPGRVFNVSFDDNYRSWHEALADLDRLDLITTFYANSLPFRDVADASTIAAYFDRLALGVGREPLSRSELADIARAGHGIGCHSHSHFVMSSLSHSAWDAEIRASKSILEDIIGSEVRHFSWPYGMPRHFSEPLKDYCLAAGFHSIAAAAPCMLHAGIGDRRSVPRSLWRADRSVADNLIDLAIDGRLMTRLTGRSPIG